MRLRQACAAVLFSVAAAVPAVAETVAYHRSQLATASGAAAVRAAIADAAERACRREHDGLAFLGPRARRQAVAECVAETIAAAERQAGLGAVQVASRE